VPTTKDLITPADPLGEEVLTDAEGRYKISFTARDFKVGGVLSGGPVPAAWHIERAHASTSGWFDRSRLDASRVANLQSRSDFKNHLGSTYKETQS